MSAFPVTDTFNNGAIVRLAAYHNLHERDYVYALMKIVTTDGEVLWYRTGLVRPEISTCAPGVFHGWDALHSWLVGGVLTVNSWLVVFEGEAQ